MVFDQKNHLTERTYALVLAGVMLVQRVRGGTEAAAAKAH